MHCSDYRSAVPVTNISPVINISNRSIACDTSRAFTTENIPGCVDASADTCIDTTASAPKPGGQHRQALLGQQMQQSPARRTPLRQLIQRLIQATIGVALLLMLHACANSTLVLRPLYNSLDDRIEDPVLELADFTPGQKQQIAELIGQFHVWHRQHELPYYVALISAIRNKASRRGAVQLADVENWFNDIEERAQQLRRCSPLGYAAPVLRTLSDAQVETITQRLAERRRPDSERQNSTPAERMAKRRKNIERMLSLAGFEMTPAQREDLRTTMAEQRLATTTFRSLREQSDNRLLEILAQRNTLDASAFDAQYANYRRERSLAFRNANPEQREYNRRLWQQYTLRTIAGLSAQQREQASAWLEKLARTVAVLSRDEPSFKPSQSSGRNLSCLHS